MEPYNRAKPAGRLVKDGSGKWRVEWFAKDSNDEQPIRFQKEDDDGGKAISGKKQSKNSEKKWKKERKNRLKAEAAAEAARARLNKAEDIEMKDPIIAIAKTIVAGGRSNYTKKRDIYQAMVRLAGERYPQERSATAFAKFATSDPTGQLLMRAHKLAGGEDWSGESKEDDTPQTSSAYAELTRKARKLQRKLGISFEAAFLRAYQANPDLASVDKAWNAGRIAKAMSSR
jgi:hypothetical protein